MHLSLEAGTQWVPRSGMGQDDHSQWMWWEGNSGATLTCKDCLPPLPSTTCSTLPTISEKQRPFLVDLQRTVQGAWAMPNYPPQFLRFVTLFCNTSWHPPRIKGKWSWKSPLYPLRCDYLANVRLETSPAEKRRQKWWPGLYDCN